MEKWGKNLREKAANMEQPQNTNITFAYLNSKPFRKYFTLKFTITFEKSTVVNFG